METSMEELVLEPTYSPPAEQESVDTENLEEQSATVRPAGIPAGPIDEWGPRTCPFCGSPPYVYCVSSTGQKAKNPHKERWPERPIKAYGRKKRRQEELREQKRLQAARRLPVHEALMVIDETGYASFRRNNGG